MSTHALEDRFDSLDPGRAARLLLWAIIAAIVGFVIWAAFARVDRVTLAHGRVIPSSQLQSVANLEGGIVEAILVKPGMRVKIGDPLVRLLPTMASAEYARREIGSYALDTRLARLRAEMRGVEPVYPAELRSQAPDLVAIEQALHTSRMRDLEAAIAAVRSRRDQAIAAARAGQAGVEASRAAHAAADQQLALIRPLVEVGAEPRLSLVQATARAEQTAAESTAALGQSARTRSAIVEANAMIRQQYAAWRARAAQELADAQVRSTAERRSLPALADRVSRTTLRAPLSGIVNRVMVATIGGTVRPGETLVEVVPDKSRLIVEARVLPADIAAVRVNQPAVVKLTAYDYAIYGWLKGRVTTISPDAIVVQQGNATQSYYIIRVETDAEALKDAQGGRLPIGPGMIADVDLLGEKRSILSYILSPITRLQDRAFRE